MAAPTVQYFEASAGTGSALISVWMPKLHDLLLAAGWSIEFADSDAIGGGSSGTPAWDKTATNNSDAGIAVYRMPANGHATQWYVRVRPGWAGATSRANMRGITVGTNHDGTGGVSGTEATPGNATTATDNRAWQLATSEDGLIFTNGSQSNSVFFCVERARLPDGTVTDDVTVMNTYSSLSTQVLNASSGVVNTQPPRLLGEVGNGGQIAIVNSVVTTSRDGATVVAIGPYYCGAYPLFGLPRLFFFAAPGDAGNSETRIINVDSGEKEYVGQATSPPNGSARFMVATE